MSAPTPIISVIVVCKNPGPGLEPALTSVWEQRGADLELVVIDGGSSDGSPAWLAARRARIATLISEPDRGIYDAMNKGVAAARGDWVLFLGADDRLAAETVGAQMADALRASSADVVVGEAVYDDRRVYRLAAKPNPLARNFVHHQAAFYRRRLFTEHGGFDPSLSIMADYDFNLRLWKKGSRLAPSPVAIAECGSGGLSDAGTWRGYAEEIRVRHRHFSAWRCWIWDAGSVARYLRKKILRSQARK